MRHLGETARGGETQISGDYIRVCVRASVQLCTYSEEDEITEMPKSLFFLAENIFFSQNQGKKVGGWLECVRCNLCTLHKRHYGKVSGR